MKDIEIVEQLMSGNHLSDKELKRAKQIVWSLSNELIKRDNTANRKYLDSIHVINNPNKYPERLVKEANTFIDGYLAKEREMLWGGA